MTNEPLSAALDEAVADVKWDGQRDPSDYWRGFNDGVYRLAQRLDAARSLDVIVPVLLDADMGPFAADALAEKIAFRVRAALNGEEQP